MSLLFFFPLICINYYLNIFSPWYFYYSVIALELNNKFDQWIISNKRFLVSLARKDISFTNQKHSKSQKKKKKSLKELLINWNGKTSPAIIMSNKGQLLTFVFVYRWKWNAVYVFIYWISILIFKIYIKHKNIPN